MAYNQNMYMQQYQPTWWGYRPQYMSAIKVVYPLEYENVMAKIRNL